MNIITISREFGSGGRELGKRLADILNFAYYDKEIISTISSHCQAEEEFNETMEHLGDPRKYPISIAKTFENISAEQKNTSRVLIAQNKALKEIAELGEDCIFVGRSADVILQEYNPLNLFIYADMESKIKRCRERLPENEVLSDEEIENEINLVDGNRAKYRELLTNRKRGQKENYHLCINTTGWEIKDLAPIVAEYAKAWMRGVKL